MMNYVEKPFPPIELPNPMGEMDEPSSTPPSLERMKQSALEKLPIMRKMMGGISRHIVKQPIVMEDYMIDGHKEPIKIRVYATKTTAQQKPLVLFFHGGGWFGGSLWAVEEYCKGMADILDGVVISVEYHLAPEHPYPCGFLDCDRAVAWGVSHADLLGINPQNITLSGDSAGGNIAAALSIKYREERSIPIRNQILLYPAVSFSNTGMTTPAGDDDPMGRVIMDWYMGEKPLWDDPYLSPLCVSHGGNLPRLLMIICELDGLQAQGKAYAEKLSAAGTETTCILYKNTPHAFIDFTGVMPQGEDLLAEVSSFVTRGTAFATEKG